MAKRGRPRKMENLFNAPSKQNVFTEGNKSSGILDDFSVRKAIDTQEGTVTKVPVNNYDIVNKAYIDSLGIGANYWVSGGGILQPVTDSHQLSAANLIIDGTISGGVVTGTNITAGADPGHTHTIYVPTADMTYLSGTVVADIATDVAANTVSCATIANISAATLTNATNITGNDTDITYLSGTVVAGVVTDVAANTLSCATIADISAATLVNTTHSAGDGSDHADVAANTISCATIANISAATLLNTGHRNDNTQAHSDYLLNNSDDTMIGVLTLSGGIVAEDNTTISTGIIRNIILGTDATPPAASGYVHGTLYVQYTA